MVFNSTKIRLEQGDIITQKVDAIVNAANRTLLGGGGVDGAIHRAGGPAILEECRKLDGCETGDAKITSGGTLKVKFVIHTVGPVWHGGRSGEEELLASAYRRSLEVADENGVKSLAFPSISTGAYSYPIARASGTAVKTVKKYVADGTGINEIVFVLFSAADYAVYGNLMRDDSI